VTTRKRSTAKHILFIDDLHAVPTEPLAQRLMKLDPWGYRFHFETAAHEGGYAVAPVLKRLEEMEFLDAILLDIQFGEQHELGLTMLEEIRDRYPLLPIIMLTSVSGNLDVLETAMKFGANDYLVKSTPDHEIKTLLEIYLDPTSDQSQKVMWGNSDAMRTLRANIVRFSFDGDEPVLLVGETGVGKELAARACHRVGPRRNKPFIAFNTGGKANDLLESTLFGQEVGSFTGALTREGLVAQAHGGTLFLDEISNMSLDLQVKLLRLVEEGEYRPVGPSVSRKTEFHLITATNKDPQLLIEQDLLKPDLYYRISTYELRIAPLRERRDDIPLLARLILERLVSKKGKHYPARDFSQAAMAMLTDVAHPWSGNVRQLAQIIKHAFALAKGSVLLDAPLLEKALAKSEPPQRNKSGCPTNQLVSPDWATIPLPGQGMDLPLHLAKLELDTIVQTWELCGGNQAAVMRQLYPGQLSHYFERNIYNAFKRAPQLIEQYPTLQVFYQRVKTKRKGKQETCNK